MAKLKVLVNVSNGEVSIDGSKKVSPILESAINTLVESGSFNEKGANAILSTMVVTNIDLEDYLEDDFEYEQEMFTKDNQNYIVNVYEAPLESLEKAISDTMNEINEMYLEHSNISLYEEKELEDSDDLGR